MDELQDEDRQEFVRWLHRLEGQVRGVAGMVERGEAGDEVLTQLAAVRSSVSTLTLDMLNAYVEAAIPSATDDDSEGDDDAAERLKRSLSVVFRHS
ncbi:MAG: metal-sensing transcriptional repressor [Candidatus Bipolaricaulia bacterium]